MLDNIYDVCIVGSGFCGYAAYKELSKIGLNILLVEGGGLNTPNSINEQKFYDIKKNNNLTIKNNLKIKNDLDPCLRDRSFTLGGSSETWKGYLRPFEESTYTNFYKDSKSLKWGELNLSKYNEKSLLYLKSPIISLSPIPSKIQDTFL